MFVQLNALTPSPGSQHCLTFPLSLLRTRRVYREVGSNSRSHLTWTHPSWRRTPSLPGHFPGLLFSTRGNKHNWSKNKLLNLDPVLHLTPRPPLSIHQMFRPTSGVLLTVLFLRLSTPTLGKASAPSLEHIQTIMTWITFILPSSVLRPTPWLMNHLSLLHLLSLGFATKGKLTSAFTILFQAIHLKKRISDTLIKTQNNMCTMFLTVMPQFSVHR